MKVVLALLTSLFLMTTAAAAQQTAAPADSATWEAWRALLPGTWSCEGAFANGREHAATIRFASALDDKWLRYEHEDRPPGRFNAVAHWGFQYGSGSFISTMVDNYGGARRFSGEATPAQLVFSLLRSFSPSAHDERFTYRRENDGFRMIWEVSRDGGESWRMGDYLVCAKQ